MFTTLLAQCILAMLLIIITFGWAALSYAFGLSIMTGMWPVVLPLYLLTAAIAIGLIVDSRNNN
jgi:hypothetical protein